MSILFRFLFLLIPIIFYPKSSEVFEFNKIIMLYIFTILIASAWIFKMILQKKIIFRRTILDIPLLLFLLSQIFATIFSIDRHTSIFGYYSRFNGGLISTFCYCLLYWAYVSNMGLKESIKVLKIILATGFLVSIYAILEHFGKSISCLFISGKFDVSCWVQDVKTRVFATFGQPNWLAAFTAAIIPISWQQAINSKFEILNSKQNKITKSKTQNFLIWITVFILLFMALLFTKSRSGLLGFGISYLIFWIFNAKKYSKEFLLTTCYLLLATILIGTPWTPGISNNNSINQSANEDLTITPSGDIRKIVWQGAIDIWKHYPIFGTGVETFAYSYYQFRPASHNLTSEWNFLYNKAHNEYLNYMANSGTVGLITYLLVIIFSIYQIAKNSKFEILNPKQLSNSKKTNSKLFRISSFGHWNLFRDSDFEIRILKISLLAGYSSLLVTNFFGFSVVSTSLLFFLYPALAVTLKESIKDQESIKQEIKLTNKRRVSIFILLLVTCYLLLLSLRYWYSDYLYAKGQKENIHEEYSQATENLQKAINLWPKEAAFHTELGQSYASLGLAPEAQKEAETAMQLSPRNIKVLEQSSNIYIDLAETDESYYLKSIQILERITTLAPTNAKAFYILSLTYAKIGETEKAIENAKIALFLKPDYDKPQLLLNILSKPD